MTTTAPVMDRIDPQTTCTCSPPIASDSHIMHRDRCAFAAKHHAAWERWYAEWDEWTAKAKADIAAGVVSAEALDYIEWSEGKGYGEISQHVQYMLTLLRKADA